MLRRLVAAILVASLSLACGRSRPEQGKTIDVPPAVRDAVAASDRSPADRLIDANRHPAETLAFFRIGPGMRTATIGVGGGYVAELMARVVGPTGVVYGHNSPFLLQSFAEKPWRSRLVKPFMRPVVRVDREFDDPLPAEARDLDAVVSILIYHDTVWLGTDRARMNAAIFRALKPGGVYGIVDHSGRPGTGSTEAKTIHRIEEAVVRQEVEAAGFRFDADASFLRNPADARDWNDSPNADPARRGTSDRFVLRFVKPAG